MWLMTRSAIEEIEQVRHAAKTNIVPLPRETVEARTPEIKIKRGNVAVIPIRGPLMSGRDAALDFFGVDYTLYSEIQDLTIEAITQNVKRIDYEINSPGGTIEGLYSTMRMIKDAPVRTRAVAQSTMASAAYMLASQTDRIDAADDLSMVGSVGVATGGMTVDWYKEVANTDSPKKRPDLSTEDGVKAVQEELDDIYQVLAERIAEGRKVDVDTVKQQYGQGAMMTARTALQKGMIDGIVMIDKTDSQKQTATNEQNAVAEQETVMTLDDLREQHPSIYREALKAGATKERGRVAAHLVMAEASGDLETAVAAIKDGSEPDAAAQAHHTAFGIKNQAIKLRAEEAPPSVDTSEPVQTDPAVDFKTEMEAAVPGLEWEVQ